jgi:hypothetical protein
MGTLRLQLMALRHYLQTHDALTEAEGRLLVERDFLSVVLFSREFPDMISLLATIARTQFVPLPTVVLYADADPDVCFENVQHRGQSGDADLTLSKIEALHEAHGVLVGVYADAGVPMVARSAHLSDEESVASALQALVPNPSPLRVTDEHVLRVAGLLA